MLAKIRFTGSPTAANFGSDVVAVLTGETDPNNLSSAILPGATEIASTYPAGWEVWDSSTGVADTWVLRAPCDGDATQYKYMKLRFVYSTYLYMYYQLMEDWNPTTNTATNAVNEKSIQMARAPIDTTGDNTQLFYLMATNRYIYVRNTGYLYTTGFPCIEIDRIHPCLGVGNGYLPAVQTQNNPTSGTSGTTYYTQMPRILDDAGTADITNAQIRLFASIPRPSGTASEFDSLSSDVGYDSGGTPSYGIHLMVFEHRETIGSIIGTSEISKIWMMQAEAVAGFEDQTLHTLDTPDDVRVMWDTTNNIVGHGLGRYVIQAE